jgi:UPF0755 protein
MKSNKTVLYRFVIFGIVLFITIGGLWFWWNDSISAVDPTDETPEIFIVSKGDGVKTIASNLAQEKLIRSPIAFFVKVKLSGIERQLQAGQYRLNRNMNASQISRELTHGIMDVWVTIPEGWRSEEIATKLTKDLDIPESEFMKYSQEGYMFPDTYLIPKDATVAAIAQILINNFHKKVPDLLLSEATRKNNLKSDEVIILASIVEREGRSDQDRPMIAGILLNRLKQKMPLQVDATLQYILGYQPNEKTWWRKSLSDEDKTIDSLYNTYKYVGLPLKPIANPGLSAIKAVINPVSSNYLYYLHDQKGIAHYASTLVEHTANIEKYLRY